MGTVIVVVDDIDIDFRANEGRFDGVAGAAIVAAIRTVYVSGYET